MEVLSRRLRDINTKEFVSYHPKCCQLRLNHLIFADDLMVFTRGDSPSVAAVMRALSDFSLESGLQANCEKTNIFFGGVTAGVKELILTQTGFTAGHFPCKYLGLPLNSVNNKRGEYQALISKICSKVLCWSSTFLSYAGRLQLLNSVVFGLTNYWCLNAMLPVNVAKKIDQLSLRFFWYGNCEKGKMVFKGWDSICAPWNEGGFNVKHLLYWNKALMARWLWLYITGKGGLWSKWYKHYVLKEESIWDISRSERYTATFNGVLLIRDEVLQAAGGHEAAESLIKSWTIDNGFNVGVAYNWFRPKNRILVWLRGLQTTHVTPRIISVLAGQKKLATQDNLKKRGMHSVNRCVLCLHEEETSAHLFFHCIFLRQVWQNLLCWMQIIGRSVHLRKELQWSATKGKRRHWKHSWFYCCLAAAVYSLWTERNARVFEEKYSTSSSIVKRIKFDIFTRLRGKGVLITSV